MTRASQKGQEFIDTMLEKASLPPGREERWKWAMRQTFLQDFSHVEALEETIEAMGKVGRFEYSGHSPEIVEKAWNSEGRERDSKRNPLFLEGRIT